MPESHSEDMAVEYADGRLRSEAIFDTGLEAVSAAIRDGLLEQSYSDAALDHTALARTALKALRRARTVGSAAEVPITAVAYNHADGSIVARYDETHGVVFGEARAFPWESKYLRGPLTILWHPSDGPTA